MTYVNYPSTEYLDLPFLDLVCFNVFVEDESVLEAYVSLPQNIAGDRPLMLTEVGLDGRRRARRAGAQRRAPAAHLLLGPIAHHLRFNRRTGLARVRGRPPWAQWRSAFNPMRNPPMSATMAAWKSAAGHPSPRRRAAQNP